MVASEVHCLAADMVRKHWPACIWRGCAPAIGAASDLQYAWHCRVRLTYHVPGRLLQTPERKALAAAEAARPSPFDASAAAAGPAAKAEPAAEEAAVAPAVAEEPAVAEKPTAVAAEEPAMAAPTTPAAAASKPEILPSPAAAATTPSGPAAPKVGTAGRGCLQNVVSGKLIQ